MKNSYKNEKCYSEIPIQKSCYASSYESYINLLEFNITAKESIKKRQKFDYYMSKRIPFSVSSSDNLCSFESFPPNYKHESQLEKLIHDLLCNVINFNPAEHIPILMKAIRQVGINANTQKIKVVILYFLYSLTIDSFPTDKILVSENLISELSRIINLFVDDVNFIDKIVQILAILIKKETRNNMKQYYFKHVSF